MSFGDDDLFGIVDLDTWHLVDLLDRALGTDLLVLEMLCGIVDAGFLE
jgi:hypothetical protein